LERRPVTQREFRWIVGIIVVLLFCILITVRHEHRLTQAERECEASGGQWFQPVGDGDCLRPDVVIMR
jgi:hypothetical protein